MEDYSFANYSVYDLRRYLISKGITVGSFRKASLVKLAEATAALCLEDNIDFHDDVLDLTSVPLLFLTKTNKNSSQSNKFRPRLSRFFTASPQVHLTRLFIDEGKNNLKSSTDLTPV